MELGAGLWGHKPEEVDGVDDGGSLWDLLGQGAARVDLNDAAELTGQVPGDTLVGDAGSAEAYPRSAP